MKVGRPNQRQKPMLSSKPRGNNRVSQSSSPSSIAGIAYCNVGTELVNTISLVKLQLPIRQIRISICITVDYR